MCDGVVAKAGARIKIKGGLKIDNAASRRRVLRIICIMLIIGPFWPVFFAIAEKMG